MKRIDKHSIEVNKYYPNYNSNPRSRYNNRAIIKYADGSMAMEVPNLIKVPTSLDDTYHAVTASDKDRLDLISFNYYDTSLYWWIIAAANSIINPFDVPFGTVLRIPTMDTVLAITRRSRINDL